MADLRARSANLGVTPVLDFTVIRCASAVGLLVAWSSFLLARAPWPVVLSHTHNALLMAPATGVVVVIAAGLASGSFVAWWAATGVLSVSLLVSLQPGHPWLPVAVAAGVLAVLLAAGHGAHPGAPPSSAPGWLIAAVVAEATTAVLGVTAHLAVVPVPLLLTGLLVVALVLYRQHRRAPLNVVETSVSERMRLRHGNSHISCFAASADKQAVALPGGAVVAFRVAAGVAIVAGDPLGRPDQMPRAVNEFVALCERQGWTPCFFQTTAATRAVYQRAGLRTITFGEEAVVELATFSLDGSRHANLRHEVARARRAGLTAHLLTWAEADAALRAELDSISTAWLRRHAGRELGFSLGRYGETIDSHALLAVVRRPSGEVAAFSTWLRLGADGIGLDVVRRHPNANPGAVDLCISATLDDARRRGLRIASLGLVPFREGGDNAEHGGRGAAHSDGLGARGGGNAARGGPLVRRARAVLFTCCIGGYRYRTLARFKDKFGPRWQPRDIAFPRAFAAPSVMTALLAVHLRRAAPLTSAQPTAEQRARDSRLGRSADISRS